METAGAKAPRATEPRFQEAEWESHQGPMSASLRDPFRFRVVVPGAGGAEGPTSP